MLVKILSIKDALSLLPERKNLFFVPKDSVRYVRFVNDFESFIPIKMHKNYDKDNGRYETNICYSEDCPYCANNQSNPEFFLPIYECDENGHIPEQKERLWQLPYGDLYYQINNSADKVVKENIKKFAIRIDRMGNKYKFEYKYVFPDYENLDTVKRVNTMEDWVNFLVSIYGDDYMKNKYKESNRGAVVIEGEVKNVNGLCIGSVNSPPTATPTPTTSDPLYKGKVRQTRYP